MINQKVRLIAPKQLRVDFTDEDIKGKVIVRPTYLSICAADQRYYTGDRDKAILSAKLPMSLIHEGVGQVIFDDTGKFKSGQNVVMIPNTPEEKDEIIKENYLRSSKFRASGFDGFMQNVVCMNPDRVINCSGVEEKVSVLLELVSVIINALEAFKKHAHQRRTTIGVWGNGNLGFITSLLLKKYFPETKVYIFGIDERKMQMFSFVDACYYIDNVPEDLVIDHAFECAGGRGSESAIDMIIDHINPQGTISLLGVSEQKIEVNTRMVLEKGLSLIGNSRSGYSDFKKAVELLKENRDIQEYLNGIISEEITINQTSDVARAFEHDKFNDFKTIMKWNM